jgi:alpha-tubulin suppressor-like RCC1 family protein
VFLPPAISNFAQYVFQSKRVVGFTSAGALKQQEFSHMAEKQLVYPNGSVFVQLRGGEHYCAALTSTGELFTFGGTDDGTNEVLGHGDGAVQHHPKPVQISQKLAKICCTAQFMAVLTKTGEVWCWGRLSQDIVWSYPVSLFACLLFGFPF